MSLDQFKQFAKATVASVVLNDDVWLYTRISTKDQFSNRSLQNQLEAGKEFSLTNSYNLTETFGGTYESASGDFTRKEFQKLIAKVKKSRKRPFAILIFKMSRFSRTGGKAIALATELVEELGVHLIEVSSSKSTLTERGKLEIYDRLLKAREENLERLEITLPGMKRLLENGYRLGSSPRGYDHYGPRVKDLTRLSAEQKLVINQDGELLKKAWKWKRKGVKDTEILRQLRELGMKISRQQISAMWRNPFYCGVIVSSLLDGEVVEGNHKGLVSKKDFLYINKMLEQKKTSNYQTSTLKENENLPLNKFVKSALDDTYAFTGYCVKSKGLYYYKNNKPKSRENISAKKLHKKFVAMLQNYELSPELTDTYKEVLNYTFDSVFAVEKDKHEAAKKQLEDLNKKIARLEERFVFEEISKDQYERFRAKLNDQKAQISFTNKNLNSNREIIINQALSLSQNLSKIWESGSLAIKKAIQNMVFPNGIVLDVKNDLTRTNSVNAIFQLISTISSDCEDKKKRQTDKNINLSRLVAGAGLEPTTFGL